jgi:hypothetical protein
MEISEDIGGRNKNRLGRTMRRENPGGPVRKATECKVNEKGVQRERVLGEKLKNETVEV